MTVKISKPAINVREELADLKKPTGIAGEAMLRAETPQEQFNLIGAGRRNLLINGNFQVWQRGTSFSSNDVYTADRVFSQSSGNFQTFERVQDAVGVYHMKVTRTGGSYNNICFSVENGMNLLSGKSITFSFLIKGSVDTTIDTTFRRSSTGVGGTSLVSDGVANASTDHSISTGWSHVSQTIQLRDTYQATDFNLICQIGFKNIPTNAYIEIKEVQLELGKVATPFEHRSYGEELALCQRYFQIWEDDGNTLGAGVWYNSNQVLAAVPLQQVMRASPTVTVSASNWATVYGVGTSHESNDLTTSVDKSRVNSLRLNLNMATTTTAGQGAMVMLRNGDQWLKADAEL